MDGDKSSPQNNNFVLIDGSTGENRKKFHILTLDGVIKLDQMNFCIYLIDCGIALKKVPLTPGSEA